MKSESIQNNAEYQKWKEDLIRLVAEKTIFEISEIRIKDAVALTFFESGMSPSQTFRETWEIENDSE